MQHSRFITVLPFSLTLEHIITISRRQLPVQLWTSYWFWIWLWCFLNFWHFYIGLFVVFRLFFSIWVCYYRVPRNIKRLARSESYLFSAFGTSVERNQFICLFNVLPESRCARQCRWLYISVLRLPYFQKTTGFIESFLWFWFVRKDGVQRNEQWSMQVQLSRRFSTC